MAGIYCIQSNSLKNLRRVLIDSILKENPLPPFEQEHILVHSNGMAQWLTNGIAESMGICANIQFTLPTKFIFETYDVLLRNDFKKESENPFETRFGQDILAWQIFYILNKEHRKQPVFSLIQNYLKEDHHQIKQRLLSQTLARVYEQYQTYRADWLDSWQKGKLLLNNENEKWQAALWELLNTDPSRSALFKKYLEKIEKIKNLTVEKPENAFKKRLVVFGLNGLSPQNMEFLIHYSNFSNVYFFIHNPTPLFWGDLIHEKEAAQKTVWKNKKNTMETKEDNLLALFGKQGQDALNLFYFYTENKIFQEIEYFEEPPKDTLLNQIKNAIFNLNQPENPVLKNNDFSISIHQNYTPLREVEVLNNLILKELDGDPTLNPRDILILAPDIEKYSPFIDSVFGAYPKNDPRFIPYSIADRKKINTSLFLRVLKDILLIDEIHANPNQIFNILESPLVQKHFQLNLNEIHHLKNWVNAAQIRWGLSAPHRKTLYPNLSFNPENTWQKGMNRLILGFAMGEALPWENHLALPLTEGLNAQPLGKLFFFIQTLEKWSAIFNEEKTIPEWGTQLKECVRDFFGEIENNENDEIRRFLLKLEDYIAKHHHALKLLKKEEELNSLFPIQLLREDLFNLLEEGGLKQPFLDGKLIFATFMPMRAIPYRQIYILGLNDQDYPRKHNPLEFDLMAQYKRTGDRARVEDDRYMFLEALLAAEEKLVLSYIAQNARDNSHRAPSILLGQLQAYIEKYWGKESVKKITTLHPLHIFNSKYSEKNNPLFTYAKEWFSTEKENTSFHFYKEIKLHNNNPEKNNLESLEEVFLFLKSPLLFFYQKTFNANLNNNKNLFFEETENFGDESLEIYQMKHKILHSLKNACYQQKDLKITLKNVQKEIQHNDSLPWGSPGVILENDLIHLGESFIQRLSSIQSIQRKTDFKTLHAEIEIILEFTVEKQLIISASNLKNKNIYSLDKFLKPWLYHLFINAEHLNLETQFLGVVENEAFPILFPPIPTETAKKDLENILSFFHLAQTRPLPITLKSALAYLKNNSKNEARKAFQEELTENTALNITFEDFDSIDFEEFQYLIQNIYAPFYNFITPFVKKE